MVTSDQYVGIKITVKVAYDANIPHVVQALMECAKKHHQVPDIPPPRPFLQDLGKVL